MRPRGGRDPLPARQGVARKRLKSLPPPGADGSGVAAGAAAASSIQTARSTCHTVTTCQIALRNQAFAR